METTKFLGEVKFYNRSKGYGFVIESKTGKEYFFHVTGVVGPGELTKADKATFELQDHHKGIQAFNVKKV